MADEEPVLIEKFKGLEIFFDKEHEEFFAKKQDTEEEFRNRSLYYLKGEIKKSKVEPLVKQAYLETGYFHKQLTKIQLLSINRETKEIKYKVLACSESGDYDHPPGKLKESEYEKKELMPVNKETDAAFEAVKKLQEAIEKLEDQQEEIVSKVTQLWGGKALCSDTMK